MQPPASTLLTQRPSKCASSPSCKLIYSYKHFPIDFPVSATTLSLAPEYVHHCFCSSPATQLSLPNRGACRIPAESLQCPNSSDAMLVALPNTYTTASCDADMVHVGKALQAQLRAAHKTQPCLVSPRHPRLFPKSKASKQAMPASTLHVLKTRAAAAVRP